MLNPGPPSPSRRNMPDHEKCIGDILDEPNTIDRLNNVPTPCSIITGNYSTLLIELAQGIVQPKDKECHTVPVQDGYVMVKIDFVHENSKDVALPIPLLEADIFTLGDAHTMRIQWKKSSILIPPIGRSSTSGAPKRSRTPTPDPKNVKKDDATCDDPPGAPKKKRPATPKKKGKG